MRKVRIRDLTIANDHPLVLIGGPCSLESEAHALKMAGALKEITDALGIGYIFKGSYDKAQRTSIHGKRGLGMELGLRILETVKRDVGVPVTSDVHTEEQYRVAGEVLDLVQVPADLSRQTDILIAAGKTGKAVNIKKAQFLSPEIVDKMVEKVTWTGNENVMVTERGYAFGYGNLVADMRSIELIRRTGTPAVFDASHTVQQPNAAGGKSGGDRSMIPVLASAATAVGIAAVFMEIHDDPENAWSDGPSSLRLDDAEPLLRRLAALDRVVKSVE